MKITFVIVAVLALLSISEIEARRRRPRRPGGDVSAPSKPHKTRPSHDDHSTHGGGSGGRPPRKQRPDNGGGNSVEGPEPKDKPWLSNNKRPTRRPRPPKNDVDGSPGMSHPHTGHSGVDTVVVPDRAPNIINVGLPIAGTIPMMPQPFLDPMHSAGPAPVNTMPGSDMYSTYPAPGSTYPALGSTYPAPGSTYPAPGSTYPGNTIPGTDMYGPNTGMGGPIPGSSYPDLGTGYANPDGLGNTQLDGFGSSYPQYSQGGDQYGGNGYSNGGVM